MMTDQELRKAYFATSKPRRYPSYCCQKCGDQIGWVGRFMFPFLHKCDNKGV